MMLSHALNLRWYVLLFFLVAYTTHLLAIKSAGGESALSELCGMLN